MNGAGGPWTAPVRGVLRAAAGIYGWGIDIRNRRFDSGGAAAYRLPCPVISVGNLTTGGTGKTPLVIDLLGRLLRRGLRPAVVSRGYRSSADGPADEMQIVADRHESVIRVADADRVSAGWRACEAGANVIVLDDGFQHRRLVRDLDFVVVDATCPFGFGYLLPRGLLREPLTALRRADVVVLSRANQVDAEALAFIRHRLNELAPRALRVVCTHAPSGLTDINGRPVTDMPKRAVLVAGIGNPGSFANAARAMGVEPVRTIWRPDHHRYAQRDVNAIANGVRAVDCDAVLTTEKDAVKLRRLDVRALEPLRVLKVDIEYHPGDAAVVDHALDGLLVETDRNGEPAMTAIST